METKRKLSGRDVAGFLLLGLSLIMLGKSLMLCFSNDIWYDELFTVGMAEHSYGELVRFTAADVHPPLYYCIVKLFVDLCKLIMPGVGTVIPAKIVSVLPYFILLLYAVTLIRKRFGLFVGGMFLFCVTAMPQLPAYTVEVRMYGWALLFVTAVFLHAGELIGIYVNQNAVLENARGAKAPVAAYGSGGAGGAEIGQRQKRMRCLHGAAFTLYGLAAAYTQYFACVAVVMVYLWVLLAFWRRDRRRVREWLLCTAVSVVGYVPWLAALTGQLGAVSENYWILPLTWRSLGGCVKFLMKPAFSDERVNTVLAVVLFASYFILWCRLALKLYHNGREKEENSEDTRRGERKGYVERVINGEMWGERERTIVVTTGIEETGERFQYATAGVMVLAGLVAFGFAASFLLRPIFVYRYMIPALGCFWLGFAICVDDVLCKPKMTSANQTYTDNDNEKLCKLKTWYVGAVLTILAVVVGLRDYRAFMGEEEYKIRLMSETEEALAQIGLQDIVLYNFDQVQAVTGYYLPETVERYLWQAEGEKLIQEITSSCGTVEDVAEIKKMLEKNSLWFIGSFNSREDIVEQWRQAGLEVEETGSFLLERYWFNLYKIS